MSKIMELADAMEQVAVNLEVALLTDEPAMEYIKEHKIARAALQAEVEMLVTERDALREKLAAVEKDAEMLRAALEYVCNTCDWHGDDGQDAMRKAVAVLEATK